MDRRHHPPHHHHSHAAPRPARITDVILHIHYPQHGEIRVNTATIAGTTPTKRIDGSDLALTEIASIDIFDDIGDGNGPQKIGSLPGPAATFSFTSGVLQTGKTHSFDVVVNDTAGHSSAISNIGQVFVPATLAAPEAVNDLTVTLNTVPDGAAVPPAAEGISGSGK